MDPAIKERIESTLRQNDVVLFMKGNRTAPQCGFSATVVQILDSLVDDYHTVNVLADDAIRQGIKDFTQWPTIPQLYVKGEFIGGCDIVKEMYDNGELEQTLGVEAKPVAVPQITLTEAASQAFQGALQQANDHIRLEVDAQFNHALAVGPRGPRDVEVQLGPVTLLLDPGSARRADGIKIDFVDGPEGKAFKIENPNEPPRVRPLSAPELNERLKSDPHLELFDVRTPREREIAQIQGARLLDREAQDHIMKLPKETPLYFHCHHGRRSQQAAEFFLNQGFKEVYNVEGGIDAWSRDVDPDIPRY